jgi:hypothetical protein
MTVGLRELRPADLNAELERILVPKLVALLNSREPGHCMRVSDLDPELMLLLCQRLRIQAPQSSCFVLRDASSAERRDDRLISSTKLVELRNPLPDGGLRPPLLVFVPADLRVAAEDSFGVATFEEISLGSVYKDLAALLLKEVPNGLRGTLAEIVRRLQADGWQFAEPLAIARYLLTVKLNEHDRDAAGAALFELGLVPDFELFKDLAPAPDRVTRNVECVRKLTWSSKSERGRVLDLELADRAFRTEFANFVADAGVEDPRVWTRRIVTERQHWNLAFHRWRFEDGGLPTEGIFVEILETSLPRVDEGEKEEPLSRLGGQLYLPVGKKGLKQFTVTFRAKPQPSKVKGLSKFVLQVMSEEGAAVGLVKSVSAWKSAKDRTAVTFSRLNKIEWEEGWYYVRATAVTEDGDPIPLLDEGGESLDWRTRGARDSTDRGPNESDSFYVVPDGEIDVTPPQRAVPKDPSLVHAWKRIQFTAVLDGRQPCEVGPRDVRWRERSESNRESGSTIEVDFGRDGLVHVDVSRQLKVLEQKILLTPDAPLLWRLPITNGIAEDCLGEAVRWPRVPAAEAFLRTRAVYFEAVRCGAKELISQALDYCKVRSEAAAYAESYQALLAVLLQMAESKDEVEAQTALGGLATALSVDSVSVDITDYRGGRRQAALVAPTHPLRALWYATWAEVGESWLKKCCTGEPAHIVPCRDALLDLLTPLSFPAVLATSAGHVMTAIDNLTPFWALYAPPAEDDPRRLLGDVCAALGLPEPAIGGTTIDGAYLAAKVERFLSQHPYVECLSINAFNPGRASVLAEMLLHLQANPVFADLRYDIRLFLQDPNASGVGESLVDLLSPSGSVTGKEIDAFSTLAESHLYPKLSLAICSKSDFNTQPDRFVANLSILFDVFPAEEVGATKLQPSAISVPVHGLIQDFVVDYSEDDQSVIWKRSPHHGRATELADAEELTDLLASLPKTISCAAAVLATRRSGPDLKPVITLSLGADDRALLYHVHDVSDWVVTIDRNMGIEFFDHGGRSDRPDYLIDHSPDVRSRLGHNLVITSRSMSELEAMLRPILQQYGLPSERPYAEVLLNQIRSLSGRLALKLISSPTQRAEVLGLGLARLYLDYQGVFRNQIVVPLDAHLDLYRSAQKQANELGDEVSFRRTDLALFDLDAANLMITCRLVEVKCYSDVGDFGAYSQLKDRIAEQLNQSERIVAYHFDPLRSTQDRPDRLIKTRELVTLLQFYLERSERYGQCSPEAAEEAGALLGALELGYRLQFTRSALIFDFEQSGTGPCEVEAGIEFHRIGSDLVRQLTDAAASELVGRKADRQGFVARTSSLADLVLSVPRLTESAFIAGGRPRTTTIDSLIERTRPETEAAPVAPESAKIPEAPVQESAVTTIDDEVASAAGSPAETHPDSGNAQVAESPAVSVQEEPDVKYHVLLGTSKPSPQFGILGEVSGRTVAIDLNETHTISLFGVQGGGKSYTLGSLVEMASLPIPHINRLPRPLASIIFHYSPTQDYKPEFTTMTEGNSDEAESRALREGYGAEPKGLQDVVLVTPADKVAERRAEYPGLAVYPLKFAASELQASHWRFLMGAVGNQSTYIRQLNRIMREQRTDLTLGGLRHGVDQSRLPDNLKDLAHQRLDLASSYIDDAARLGDLIRPGRLLIVDLRDEFIEKDEALGLFVVLLQIFAEAKYQGQRFNKLVVFDEAHKYIDSPEMVAGLVEVVREMRHKGTSILVASQDPPSVPVSLIELSSQIILHKFNSPNWLKHIQKVNAALGSLTPEKLATLKPGEAYVWSSKATDPAFCQGALRIRCRPRVTHHGGATEKAVD